MCSHHSSDLDGGHRRISRRDAIAGGAGGVALLFAGMTAAPGRGLLAALGPDVAEAAATSCVMTPAKTEGPYFVDEKLDRSDIRANTADGAVQAGVALRIRMFVFDATADCAPVPGATVDIWHANAAGRYSDEAANGTAGQDWLRGFQTTDADGMVEFITVYPGWYTGRAVHIHFKVRTDGLEFTSQMFFTDAMNDSGLHHPRALQRAQPADCGHDRRRGRDPRLGRGDPDARAGRRRQRRLHGRFLRRRPGRLRRRARHARSRHRHDGRRPAQGRRDDAHAGRRAAPAPAARRDGGRHGGREAEPRRPDAREPPRGAHRRRGRAMKLAIPGATRAGAAKLRLTFTDAAGNRKRVVRHLHVAARRR